MDEETSAPIGRQPRARRRRGFGGGIQRPPSRSASSSIREPIELGERSTGYHVEIKQNGSWTTPKDSSGNQVKGTVIGQRQLWQLGKTTADGIALVIDSARGIPAISEFGSV